ncbi:MAG TPA: bifunctional molybdenum cofactor biosynthesis protein MoaC/MoaB [Chitinophagaceae bacterium]|nr:bifunctional molybdenum cofactor biosynthesis protein MoaC/MoaB [Chitinophagaceae bacterium]
MVNITHKQTTLRKAIAAAVVKVSKQETMDAIKSKTVPKGDVFEFSRAAGLLAIKKTSEVIPDCHPLPVEFAEITYSAEDLQILISVEVHTIYKTGVEVEAMHGASVVALVIYDMLKPIDKGIEIASVRLKSKSGGKSDIKMDGRNLKTAVVVCSDTVSKGEKEDKSGKRLIELLNNFSIETKAYKVISDDAELIQSTVKKYVDDNYDIVLFTGGTGLSKRDNTPEAIQSLIEKEIPGITETARNYGQQRMPYAMLSRGVAGFVKDTLVLTFPGSVRGVEETMDALFPQVLHVFEVRKNKSH